MKLLGKNQKGEGNIYYIGWGILIALCAVAAIKYYHDHNNDITIHVPTVEVR